MPHVHGLLPADEQKDTSRDCDKGENRVAESHTKPCLS